VRVWPKLRFIYRALKARYRDQRCEIAALVEKLRPSDIAVDVGANKGSYLLWLSRAVYAGRVVAFEPQSQLAEYLTAACAAWGLTNVTISATAVSEANGEMRLFVPGDENSPGASLEKTVEDREKCQSVKVPVISLDRYFENEFGRIGAIKIDTEGHELAVFRGAERILREHRPLLVFECESRHLSEGNVLTVLKFIREKGYDGWFVCRGRLRPISEFREELHQRKAGDRYWDSADYCNNFIMERKV
jgi:FkbM family methyltransferase